MKINEQKEILANVKESDVVFFDCFDTVLYRKHSPEYPFLRFANFLISDCGVIETLPEVNGKLFSFFYRCDIPLSTMLSDVFYHFGIGETMALSKFIELATDALFKGEKDNCYLAPLVVETLATIHQKGAKAVLLSDFYLGQDVLNKIIVGLCGQSPFDGLIISCDYCATKYQGDLYEIAKEKFPANRCLMVGDNKRSDFHESSAHGFQAFLLDSSSQYQAYRQFNKSYESLCEKRLRKVYVKDREKFSANYSYLLFAFCKRLYAELKEGDEVHFLAREGQFLKKCFDEYLKFHNEKLISTSYLQISRVALLLPSLDLDNCQKKDFIHAYKNTLEWNIPNLETFLTYIGFSNEQISQLGESLKTDPKSQVSDFFWSETFSAVWSSSLFHTFLKHIQEVSKNRLSNLLASTNNRFVLTDVGWRGTMQIALRKLIPESVNVVGYYIGTSFSLGQPPLSTMKGLIFDFNPDSIFFEKQENLVIESLLRADHGQLVCFREHGDFYIDDSSVDVYRLYSRERQALMLNALKKMVLFDSVCPIPTELLLRYAATAIAKRPTRSTLIDNWYAHYQLFGSKPRKLRTKDYLKGLLRSLKRKLIKRQEIHHILIH